MLNSKENTDNIYDVSKYTDRELYDILDLNGNPSDRELEAKILFLIHKYDNIQNESGDQLSQFFKDIFEHFFSSEEEENEEEGFTNLTTKQSDILVSNSKITNKLTNDLIGNTIQISDEITGNVSFQGAKFIGNMLSDVQGNVLNTIPNINADSINTIIDKLNQNQNNVGFTKQLSYTKDALNPLLNQSIKRIISIDSQYRDDKRSLSTEFTFNLSEPLRDVVSLKLYSIQIPYTWWTINANFGSNFFYLKGNSPGINTGDYDISVNILPGNYTPTSLVSTLNDALKTSLTSQTDVSFGTTSITYNSNTSLSTLKLEINKVYNETSYYLYFPIWTTPSQPLVANRQTIPSFLGFELSMNYPFIIKSLPTLPLSTSSSINTDDTQSIYLLNNTNNYFTIISYLGPDEYVDGISTVINTFKITLSTLGLASRTTLFNDLSWQIQTASFLQESSIKRIDIIDISKNNFGKSYYALQLKCNRLSVNIIKNLKTVVIFPTEIAQTTYKAIWTGPTSCFRFSQEINEMNNIISETSPISQQIARVNFNNNIYISLTCIKSYFITDKNNYSITIQSNAQGYSLSEFVNETNKGIIATNNNTITSKNTAGDFNIQNSVAFIDTDNKFHLRLDINKSFTQDNYQLDLSGSFMNTFMNLKSSYSNHDLSSNTYFNSSFVPLGSYNITGNSILYVKPAIGFGNENEPTYIVPIPSTPNKYTDSGGFYTSYQNLQNAINDQFTNFLNEDNINILNGTYISLNYNTNTQRIDCSFTVSIQRTLTEKDYNIQFIDPNATNNDGTLSVWYKDLNINPLFIDNSANLSNTIIPGQSFSDLSGSPIVANFLTIDSTNNLFYLKPYEKGVSDSGNLNDIKFYITPGSYSRNSLINTLNELFGSNESTIGSEFTIITQNSNEYTKFRPVVTKTYTASDYNLVFYDPISFTKCYSGVSSLRNTTWDTTLGWILGYRNSTVYNLSEGQYNSISPTGVITIIGDTTVSTNLFNYFLLCIDDYNQNHLNDGLVTITSKDTDIPLPSYANKSNYYCDPATGKLVYNTDPLTTTSSYNSLTQNQLYSITEIANNKRVGFTSNPITNASTKSYGSGPFVKDVFGLIPMKTAGLANGSVYVDFSGTLQNQERIFFGPVNIHRMSVKLVSDRGDIIDLNGSNWSFSLLCEQLYQQKPTTTENSKRKK